MNSVYTSLQSGWNNPNFVSVRKALTSSLQSNWENPSFVSARAKIVSNVQAGLSYPNAVAVASKIQAGWNHPSVISVRDAFTSTVQAVWNHPKVVSAGTVLASKVQSAWNNPRVVSARTALISTAEKLPSMPLGVAIAAFSVVGGLLLWNKAKRSAEASSFNHILGVKDLMKNLPLSDRLEIVRHVKKTFAQVNEQEAFFREIVSVDENMKYHINYFKIDKRFILREVIESAGSNRTAYNHLPGVEEFMRRLPVREQRLVVKLIEEKIPDQTQREQYIQRVAQCVEDVRRINHNYVGGIPLVKEAVNGGPAQWDLTFPAVVAALTAACR